MIIENEKYEWKVVWGLGDHGQGKNYLYWFKMLRNGDRCKK